MTSAEPTAQPSDLPPSHPTSQPSSAPASPNADQQYASSARLPRRLVRRPEDRLGFSSVVTAYLVAWAIDPRNDAACSVQTANV